MKKIFSHFITKSTILFMISASLALFSNSIFSFPHPKVLMCVINQSNEDLNIWVYESETGNRYDHINNNDEVCFSYDIPDFFLKNWWFGNVHIYKGDLKGVYSTIRFTLKHGPESESEYKRIFSYEIDQDNPFGIKRVEGEKDKICNINVPGDCDSNYTVWIPPNL